MPVARKKPSAARLPAYPCIPVADKALPDCVSTVAVFGHEGQPVDEGRGVPL